MLAVVPLVLPSHLTTMWPSQGIPLYSRTIFIVVLVSGVDAFGASSIPMRKFWTTLKTIELWSYCMLGFAYAIELGRSSSNPRLVPPTPQNCFSVKSSLPEKSV